MLNSMSCKGCLSACSKVTVGVLIAPTPRRGATMANPNEDVVERGYELFTAGDMDGLKKLFTPDFVHHTPGTSQVAGDHEGPDAAIALYGKYFELSGGTLKVELKSMKSDGDKVAA